VGVIGRGCRRPDCALENSTGMKIVRDSDGSRVVVRLQGALAGKKDAGALAQVVRSLLDERQSEIALDLSAVAMVDSAGLEQLLACHEQCKAAGGGCALINVSPEVSKILRITRLDRELLAQTAAVER